MPVASNPAHDVRGSDAQAFNPPHLSLPNKAHTMILFEPSAAIKGRIRERLAEMPEHLRPLWGAVLQGCAYATVVQHDGAFKVPNTRPAILVIGDDLHTSMGPSAFHRRSLQAFLSRCSLVSVVSSEPKPEVYTAAALRAIGLRHDVVIIETQMEHEAEWTDLIEQSAPLACLVLCRPFPREMTH